MKYSEIVQAVDEGKTVHWSSEAYTVKCSKTGHDIVCELNGHRVGLVSEFMKKNPITNRWEIAGDIDRDKFYIKEEETPCTK